MAGQFLLLLTTAPSRKAADKIAQTILNKRLAACVSYVPALKSVYWWKGRKETVKECLILIKSRKSALLRLRQTLQKIHLYQIPEIIGISPGFVSSPYLKWAFKEIDKRL